MSVDLKIAEIALAHTQGTDFEKFANALYSTLSGLKFVPLGGTHDGGADGFFDVSGGTNNEQSSFFQASVQADHRAKIRHTVKRLRESGRNPTSLTYITNSPIRLLDKEEVLLSTELGISLRIRDKNWILSHLGDSTETVSLYQTFIRPNASFVERAGGAGLVPDSTKLPSRALTVFLGQEIDRRSGNTELLEAVTDTLILWALEGTDPEKGSFLKRDQILARIEEVLPSAKAFVRGTLDTRLRFLSGKANPSGREVRWHKKDGNYCLPFETRELVTKENVEDALLRVKVIDTFTERARDLTAASQSNADPDVIASLAMKTIEALFEKKGLELAAFIHGDGSAEQHLTISDILDGVMETTALTGDHPHSLKPIAMEVLRRAFYQSEIHERSLFGKLSRTYALMFSLRNEPRVVEYFRGMSSAFVLYVGADILVRALSESYLPEADRAASNMLKIMKAAGATLILSQPSLDEVHSHLHGTDVEFQTYFASTEHAITLDLARHASKILIRTYFYARLGNNTKKPAGWKSFIGQFVDYEHLHKDRGKQQLRAYLQEEYGFEFESTEDLDKMVDQEELSELSNKIGTGKKFNVLAVNDARQILAVYGKRAALREGNKPNPYGFKTWWLTDEARVMKHTADLVAKHKGRCIMRPDFVLNFVSWAPSLEEVRRSYAAVFPTTLGIQLSNRLKESVFHDVMNKMSEAGEVSDARLRAKVGEMANELKGDQFKEYETKWFKGHPMDVPTETTEASDS